MRPASDSEASRAWSSTSPRERAEVLRRAFDLVMREKEYLARLITLENGKSLADARSEVAYAAEFFRWYAEEAVRSLGDVSRAPASGARILVQHKPAGIALLITPWNFPLAMATRKIGPALAAGCTVIAKPASETPLTMLALMPLLEKAGVPAGVVNVLPSRRSGQLTDTLLQDIRVRVLSFTGSTEVGQTLLRSAAQNVVRSVMELGGNAPFIVFEDADIAASVDGAIIAKMRNMGEACTAANRFLVHESGHDAFATALAERMRGLRMGNGLDEGVALGPLVNEAARRRISDLVEDAVARGASVLSGGQIPEGVGYFYPATVLTDVPLGARIWNEEIFGPVAPIRTFRDEADAVQYANDTVYGLVAYLYTRDLQRGLRVSEQLDVGMVGLNHGLVSDPAAPFGGTKHSGLGREGSHEGIKEFLETQYVSAAW